MGNEVYTDLEGPEDVVKEVSKSFDRIEKVVSAQRALVNAQNKYIQFLRGASDYLLNVDGYTLEEADDHDIKCQMFEDNIVLLREGLENVSKN